ncbi:uncharacterized protein BXZ73DRAFT_46568 [Epithele typhae]|uniref:uncharacterized protein n=1 Tax=Epithele typhae TaxID=378194 RepID=UPI002007571C|nr:uncharacterized protein BXZ73DRAFT_46568 [Epithele typhae]KAH9933187.1 hypothetical protein BXZ73DRAFT_46568 [Epithele typhae]
MHKAAYLTVSLNELLQNLGIPLPFALESPADLTPGLLLGILESVLHTRLPISAEIRSSREVASQVEAMKIFLGVLETDVMNGECVGLSDVDPRRLAAGEDDEVEFVGELLCWLGRQKGLLAGPSYGADPPPVMPLRLHTHSSSPSVQSTVTSAAHSNLSMVPSGLAESDTTMMSTPSEQLAALAPTELPDLSSLPPVALTSSTRTVRSQARCIHEVEDPFFALGMSQDVSTLSSVCHCDDAEDEGDDLPPTPKTPLPFRYAGLIHNADEGTELRSYYQRGTPSSNSSTSRRGQRRIVTPHNAPTEYTLALLNERARLLSELAKVKGSPSSS